MRFSIIVTAYNIESYIGDCLESIKNQTYTEPYEVYIVNDGSTDGTGEIIKRYPQFQYIEHENKGISYSRNECLDLVKGDYVVFIDGDDYISLDYLEKISKIIDKYSLIDLVFLNYVCQNDIHGGIYSETSYDNSFYTKNPYDIYDHSLLATWLYVAKRSLWEGIRFPEGKYHEDVGTMYKIVQKAKEAYILADPIYIYRRRAGSITQSVFKQKDLDLFEMSLKEYNAVKDHVSYQAKRRIAWSLRCVALVITWRYKRNELTELAYEWTEKMKDFKTFLNQ